MTAAEALAAARAKLEEDAAKVAALEEEIAKDEEIVAYGRDGANVDAIVERTGISRDRVRRVLIAGGVLTSRKRKLTPQEAHEVISDLKSGLGVPETVEKRNVAESVVRRLAKENGIVSPRTPAAPKRTPEEVERIRALDAAVKQEFGAGLSALGEILRKANKANPPARPAETSVGEDDEGELNFQDEGELAAARADAEGVEVQEVGLNVETPREHHGDGDEPLPVAATPDDSPWPE